MHILKLYYNAKTADQEFKEFSEYHKYMGKPNLKCQTFTYDECGTTVYFGFANTRDKCFGKWSGAKFQMIDFEYCIAQEIKDYLLTRLRGSTISTITRSIE